MTTLPDSVISKPDQRGHWLWRLVRRSDVQQFEGFWLRQWVLKIGRLRLAFAISEKLPSLFGFSRYFYSGYRRGSLYPPHLQIRIGRVLFGAKIISSNVASETRRGQSLEQKDGQ